MGNVIRVDLRDPAVRARVRGAPVGGIATTLYRDFAASPHGSMEEVPVRLLVLLPLDEQLRADAEHLALGLLGMDPAPRTIVGLVNPSAEEPEHDPVTPDKVLPLEFAGQAFVRFADLRGSMVSMGHPRTGMSAIGTGPTDRWTTGFITELVRQLGSTAVFDAVWQGIPEDRPAAIGLRAVDLGSGRGRALADVALRLAKDLRADGEPSMSESLPERWRLDPRLQEPAKPYPRRPAARSRIPKDVQRVCDLANAGPLEALARTPGEYQRHADQAVGLLGTEVDRWTKLFRGAVGSHESPDGPTIDAAGAAKLDEATGGLVFGDPVAKAAQDEGHDMVTEIGEQLEVAAGKAGTGFSPVILMDWLRQDANDASPIGPAAVAERLANPERDWARVKGEYDELRDQPGWQLRPWVGATYQGALRENRRPADVEPAGKVLGREPAWHLPRGLAWVSGTPFFRTAGARRLFVALVVLILVAAGVQLWADITHTYPFSITSIGLPLEPWRTIFLVLALAALLYLLLGLSAGWAVRSWARQFDFERIPDLVMDLDAEACAWAVSDVARCVTRREGSRVARAAADTLGQGIELGAQTAETFARRVDPGPPGLAPEDEVLPPYRAPIAAPGHTPVVDAAGIYRLYPHYVSALRNSFSASLIDAIHTQWPRVRGMFWEDTATLISTSAARSLRYRLEEFERNGIWQGEMARQLADEMWADPVIRESAVRALDFSPEDPVALLGGPADRRLLDINEQGAVVLAIPPQLEPILADRARRSDARIIIGEQLETATLLRVFPFQPGLYTYSDPADPELAQALLAVTEPFVPVALLEAPREPAPVAGAGPRPAEESSAAGPSDAAEEPVEDPVPDIERDPLSGEPIVVVREVARRRGRSRR